MNKEILNQFLTEDCDASVRRVLLDAISEQGASNAPLVREFTFNRYNVTLDFAANVVTLQDDLTAGFQGEEKLRLEDFERSLRKAT